MAQETAREKTYKDIRTIYLKKGGSVTHKEDTQVSLDQADDGEEIVRLEGTPRPDSDDARGRIRSAVT